MSRVCNEVSQVCRTSHGLVRYVVDTWKCVAFQHTGRVGDVQDGAINNIYCVMNKAVSGR